MLRKLYSEGTYHLIPSFFKTLMYLKQQKQEFSIAFRAFGKDLDNVVFEFDRFCKGLHPCFNGKNSTPLVKFDGSKNTKSFTFKSPEEQRATIYRKGEQVNQTVFVQSSDHVRKEHRDQINDIEDEENVVLKNPHQINLAMMEVF